VALEVDWQVGRAPPDDFSSLTLRLVVGPGSWVLLCASSVPVPPASWANNSCAWMLVCSLVSR
jgi:hypothetical protein